MATERRVNRMLTRTQEEQVRKQIAAYDQHVLDGKITLSLNLPFGACPLVLDIDPYVANPAIMNSGMQMVNYLCDSPHLVKDKIVTDMGTGSGIVGITAALLGAQKVYMPELDERAVSNAQRNVKHHRLDDICDVFQSDLFENYSRRIPSEVHIFNYPFFAGKPLDDRPWTRMMLAEHDLLSRYFAQAHDYATQDAVYLLPWLTLAGGHRCCDERSLDNDPGKRAPEHGYKIIRVTEQKPVAFGVQQALFNIYELQRIQRERKCSF